MSNASQDWPVSVPFDTVLPSIAVDIQWNGDGALRIATADSCPVPLARSLLKFTEVRSVIVDHTHSRATIHLNDSHPTADVLLELESIVRRQRASIAEPDSAADLPQIASWRDTANRSEGYFRAPVVATGWQRVLLLVGAGLTFVLAMIGTILPGIPTTPFLLLTSYCLLRSSTRLHDKLLQSRTFGWLLRDWHMHRGVRPGVKSKSLAIVVIFLSATMIFGGLPIWALAVVGCFALIGVGCILRLKVISNSDASFQSIRCD